MPTRARGTCPHLKHDKAGTSSTGWSRREYIKNETTQSHNFVMPIIFAAGLKIRQTSLLAHARLVAQKICASEHHTPCTARTDTLA